MTELAPTLAAPVPDTDGPTNLGRASLFATLAALSTLAVAEPTLAAERPSDDDILNFALNLEYLEAEYYLRGVSGTTLDQALGGASLGGSVKGGRQVSFTSATRRGFVENIARNETAHVSYLRSTLADRAIKRPVIDLDAGFAAVAQAAGMPGFDPFANEMSFYLGAFLFEDVGVTAYKGAAKLIRNHSYLTAAAGILAAEAYHAGVIRSVLYKIGGSAISQSTAISGVRATLAGAREEQPIQVNGRSNIVPADENSIAFSRTPQQVHNIAYGTAAKGVTRGGFFPEGTNGKLTTS